MSNDHAHQSLATRARLVKIFAWIFAIVSVTQVALDGYFTFKPDDPIVVTAGEAGSGRSPEEILLVVAALLSLLLLASIAALVIVSLIWIHRAHSNVTEQGVPMDHSAGWTVASYFIPFVNLVVPYRAMRELHNRSHGEIDENMRITGLRMSAHGGPPTWSAFSFPWHFCCS